VNDDFQKIRKLRKKILKLKKFSEKKNITLSNSNGRENIFVWMLEHEKVGIFI